VLQSVACPEIINGVGGMLKIKFPVSSLLLLILAKHIFESGG